VQEIVLVHNLEKGGQRAIFLSNQILELAIVQYVANLNLNVNLNSAIFQNGGQRAIFE